MLPAIIESVAPADVDAPRIPLRVLVVADDEEYCCRLRQVLLDLRSFDSCVAAAPASNAALAALLDGHHDVCFLDGTNPGSGPLDISRLARAAGIQTDIVLLVPADYQGEVEALAAGVTHFVECDYVRASVLDRILRNMLLRSRLSHQHRADQRALASSEKRLRSIVEWAGILVYEWDLEAGTLEWDGSTGGPAAFDAADLPKTIDAWVEMLHPDDRERVAAAVEQHLESQAREFNEEYRIRHPDGSYRVWLDRGMVARGRDGHLVRWIGMANDVTESRQLSDRIRVTQRLEALGRLAGGVAHDFNNIITVIAGYVDSVLDDVPPGSSMSHDLRQVHNAAERAANLTRQLLAFSRKQLLEPVVLDINEVVRAVEAMLRRTIGEDIELSFEASPQLRAVRADPGQLEQVLVNLAVNARDAMPDGGELLIRTRNFDADAEFAKRDGRMLPGAYVLLEVQDSGTGIPPDVVKHIFDPFFTTKERGHGTGLGLATVYGIVKQSGGHVWVDTAVGKGTTFSIYLPCVEGAAQPLARAIDIGTRSASAVDPDKTILIVEDEPSIREMVAEVLQRAGYQVLAAGSGSEGISAAARHPGRIDLLLTDVILPGTNGLETARAIVRERPELRVLYTSGYTDDVLGSSLSDGTKLLRKPFSASALLRTVGEILEQYDERSASPNAARTP